MTTKNQTDGGSRRQPPIRIPLTFDDAVGGLLAVDPKGPVKPTGKKRPGAKKKPAGKK